jgi:hypothetical protein
LLEAGSSHMPLSRIAAKKKDVGMATRV